MKKRMCRILILVVFLFGFAAYAVDKPGKRFRHTDKNKDGVLQPVEIRKSQVENLNLRPSTLDLRLLVSDLR